MFNMSDVIMDLKTAESASVIGGKAASLGQLIKAGFNVPAGFVVTGQVPEKLVLSAFDKLGAQKVAVRSSAAAEDGAKDAWAGQLDTFLNVTSENLLEKIQLCFRSASSERAKAYAKQKNIKSGSVAVIIQTMVPSQVSGVAFSAHPVTLNRDQIVVEATKGLGEKLVSGTITPDTYIIDKKTNQTIEKHVLGKQVLDDRKLKELAETIKKIEATFGFPVDVEWAYSNGKLFILQSRPITTLE